MYDSKPSLTITMSTPELCKPGGNTLNEGNVLRVMQRIEKLIQFVSKSCFKCIRVDQSRINEVAHNLSSAIGRAASRIIGGLDMPEEEINLICLEDPEVMMLSLELEKMVGQERGRTTKKHSLATIFGNTTTLSS